MSLLKMEPFVLITQTKKRDRSGGFHYSAAPGDGFDANARLDGTSEKKSARKDSTDESYTITTSRSVVLRYHDVVQRLSDGACFRILSNGNDKQTPQGASLDMRQVSAEKWEVPK